MSKSKYGENRLTELAARLKVGDTFRPSKEGVSKCCYRRIKYVQKELGLWPLALNVCWDLMETYNPKDGGARPSLKSLADENNTWKSKIQLVISQLERAGIIENLAKGKGKKIIMFFYGTLSTRYLFWS